LRQQGFDYSELMVPTNVLEKQQQFDLLNQFLVDLYDFLPLLQSTILQQKCPAHPHIHFSSLASLNR